uniref:Uncharacterized protein n=1 Tax=Anguilla anguilla TaxID=7936 RepID=A0A0E9XC03_ANGAN
MGVLVFAHQNFTSPIRTTREHATRQTSNMEKTEQGISVTIKHIYKQNQRIGFL